MADNPYGKYLGSRDPIEAMSDTIARIESIASKWRDSEFSRSYAPGKWTAAEILVHLAQSELALGTRARMGLTAPNYTAQPFDQDRWMAKEAGTLSGPEALDAFLAIARMNLALFRSLSPADRATTMTHPEFGPISVDWVIRMMAGHQVNHLQQLEQIH